MATSKIFLIADDSSLRQLLVSKLEVKGYGVIVHSQQEDVVDKAERESPNLILLDVSMSGANGLEVGRALKGRPRTEQIPVIMLTARGGCNTVRQDIGEIKAVDYIVKPFRPDILLWKIEKILEEPAAGPAEE